MTDQASSSLDYVGRVLFIHGYSQNAGLFRLKTLALRKKLLLMKLKPIYLNAPALILQTQFGSSDELFTLSRLYSSQTEQHNSRSWSDRRSDATFTFDLAKNTVSDYIKDGTIIEGTPEDEAANLIADKEIDANIPIVGLVGFSQGAAFGAAMVDKFDTLFEVPKLQWAILCSGYMFDIVKMPQHKYLFSTDKGLSSRPTRMLHVMGELDTVVGEERSMQLFKLYEKNSTILKHPGGHFVPNSRSFVEKVTNWIISPEEISKNEEAQEQKSNLDDLLDMMIKFG